MDCHDHVLKDNYPRPFDIPPPKVEAAYIQSLFFSTIAETGSRVSRTLSLAVLITSL